MMTCAHVLGLIDAGPFADYPRAHLDAAREHARHCATCGSALEVATALTADLGALAQPIPPHDLTAAVLARIAQVDVVPATDAAMAETSVRSRDWSAWTALGGLAAGIAIVLFTRLGAAVPIDIAVPRVRGMTAGLVGMPTTMTAALLVASGLVLYVSGLFAPLDDGPPL